MLWWRLKLLCCADSLLTQHRSSSGSMPCKRIFLFFENSLFSGFQNSVESIAIAVDFPVNKIKYEIPDKTDLKGLAYGGNIRVSGQKVKTVFVVWVWKVFVYLCLFKRLACCLTGVLASPPSAKSCSLKSPHTPKSKNETKRLIFLLWYDANFRVVGFLLHGPKHFKTFCCFVVGVLKTNITNITNKQTNN